MTVYEMESRLADLINLAKAGGLVPTTIAIALRIAAANQMSEGRTSIADAKPLSLKTSFVEGYQDTSVNCTSPEVESG